MPKPNHKRGNNKKYGNDKKKEKSKHKMPASMIKRGNKREVVFDAEARRAHLRGFSERKRERRAFGLAMQKVKDRKAKIEERAAVKKGSLERIEEAEKQKEQWMEDAVRMNGGLEESDDEGSDSEDQSQEQQSDDVIDTKVYDDKTTETAWGGQVTVTTSVVALDDDDDSDEEEDYTIAARRPKSVDTAQKDAGNVQKFLHQLKGNMPGKKNRDNGPRAKRKGMNGASDMKGVGGSGNLKIASKLLSRSKDRSLAGASTRGKKGKRRKR